MVLPLVSGAWLCGRCVIRHPTFGCPLVVVLLIPAVHLHGVLLQVNPSGSKFRTSLTRQPLTRCNVCHCVEVVTPRGWSQRRLNRVHLQSRDYYRGSVLTGWYL